LKNPKDGKWVERILQWAYVGDSLRNQNTAIDWGRGKIMKDGNERSKPWQRGADFRY